MGNEEIQPLFHPAVSIAWFVLNVLFFIAMVPLLIWRRKFQPLKSRGVVPLFVLLLLTFSSCAQLFDEIMIPFHIDTPCFVFLYQLRVGIYVLFPYVIHAFRVLSMIRLQQRATARHRHFMKVIAQQSKVASSPALSSTPSVDEVSSQATPSITFDSESKTSSSGGTGFFKLRQSPTWMLTVLHITTSVKFLFPVATVMMIADALIVPLFSIAPPFRTIGHCTFDGWLIGYIISASIPLILIELYLIMASVGLVVVKERLALSFELICVMFFYLVIIALFTVMAIFNDIDWVRQYFTHAVILLYNILLIVIVLRPLIITFIWEFRMKRMSKKMKNNTSIESESDEIWEMLRDAELRKVFKKYAEQELSHENVLFFESLLRFKATKNKKHRRELANLIFNEFIKEGAILEVNINSIRRNAIAARLHMGQIDESSQSTASESVSIEMTPSPEPSPSPKESTENLPSGDLASSPQPQQPQSPQPPPPPQKPQTTASNAHASDDLPTDIFDDVVKDVKLVMHDTFVRFTNSDLYRQFAKETQTRHEILKTANLL